MSQPWNSNIPPQQSLPPQGAPSPWNAQNPWASNPWARGAQQGQAHPTHPAAPVAPVAPPSRWAQPQAPVQPQAPAQPQAAVPPQAPMQPRPQQQGPFTQPQGGAPFQRPPAPPLTPQPFPRQQPAPAQPFPRQQPAPAQPFPPVRPPYQPHAVGPWQPTSPMPLPTQAAPRKSMAMPLFLLGIVTMAILGIMVAIALSRGGGGGGTNGPKPDEYKNSDYKVPKTDTTPPELPIPETESEAKEWLRKSKLYEADVVLPVECEAKTRDLTAVSDDELEKHLDKTVACLMRVWGPTMEDKGYELPRPSVTVYSKPIQTRCGRQDTHNAFWCGADQQIYFASDLKDVVKPGTMGKPWTVESVLAHEFGHHIQGRTGIFAATRTLQRDASTEDEELELNRRVELQADCLGGAYMHSVSDSLTMSKTDRDRLLDLYGAIGDDRVKPGRVGDHGSMAARRAWGSKGLDATQLQTCNTYTAPADKVR